MLGASDLRIAEVYDVGQSGATRKPFGRVFYTKEKSLVFYAYDLEQQAEVKPETNGFIQACGAHLNAVLHSVQVDDRNAA